MRMYDLITKKRNGHVLTYEEIDFMINEYIKEDIPDYQMSAMLMAIYFNGMSDDETFYLTDILSKSGDKIDLSGIEGIKADKHSTGGVGDKTTLIIAPIIASCDVKMAKMSGRGLGHTGGTVDKLESIPGFRTVLSEVEFFDIVNKVGCSVIGQSTNLAPADKKLYALRDVTATVESIPLIAASIMSKKLAVGSDCILLDVKTGSGAFMKTLEKSVELSEKMVAIGENAGKKTVAIITNMNIPLGNAIGNSLEIIEAVDTLNGNGPNDLTEVSICLAANILSMSGRGTLKECEKLARESIDNKSALNKLISMVESQGGDSSVLYNTDNFIKADISHKVISSKEGYITNMDTERIGIASVLLGAGRETKESKIDYSAGIILKKKHGDYVKVGDELAVMFTSKDKLIIPAEKLFIEAIIINDKKPEVEKLIYARIDNLNVKYNY